MEGELHYEVTMTNTGLGTTHFDVSVNYGSGATSHGYDVISGAIVVATFAVEQGDYGIFDVSNVDDATIVDHQLLKADCKAEPYTEIGVICPADHSTPFVYLEWVNLSYTHEAYFDVYLNGDTVASAFSHGAANTHLLSFDLVHGQHVAAAILADGVVIEEVNTDVDCPPASTTTPDPTTPDTTQPDTTQPNTTPDTTQPDTTQPGSTLAEPPSPTTTVADTTTSYTATEPDSATTTPGAVAEQLPIAGDHSAAGLPVTGSGSDALIAIALKVILGGLGMVVLARRFR